MNARGSDMRYKQNGQGEKGYAWHFFAVTRSWITSFLITLFVIGVGGGIYLWYNHIGNSLTPDSGVGLGYAIVGFTFIVLAATSYTLRRRFLDHALGQLNRSLNWHIVFAIMGVTFILMHSFGTLAFDSQAGESGTFAVCSLVALIMCGILGRFLDRFLAWRIAVAVDVALTADGKDRIETLEQEIKAMVSQEGRERRDAVPALSSLLAGQASTFPARSGTAFIPSSPGDSFAGFWDTAYFSAGEQVPGLRRQPTRASRSTTTNMVTALRTIQQANAQEQMLRLVIRGWRMVHIGLAILTLSLIAWHVIAAFQFISATAGN